MIERVSERVSESVSGKDFFVLLPPNFLISRRVVVFFLEPVVTK
jgi:hypothetical protein